ncbi:hypothetical protein BD413DRAFT_563128 [Trametes elegans]|nr:hypothetical protein BD413DRAFT_563128 [Trametes elegans]
MPPGRSSVRVLGKLQARREDRLMFGITEASPGGSSNEHWPIWADVHKPRCGRVGFVWQATPGWLWWPSEKLREGFGQASEPECTPRLPGDARSCQLHLVSSRTGTWCSSVRTVRNAAPHSKAVGARTQGYSLLELAVYSRRGFEQPHPHHWRNAHNR